MAELFCVKNARVILRDRILDGHAVLCRDGVIEAILPERIKPAAITLTSRIPARLSAVILMIFFALDFFMAATSIVLFRQMYDVLKIIVDDIIHREVVQRVDA